MDLGSGRVRFLDYGLKGPQPLLNKREIIPQGSKLGPLWVACYTPLRKEVLSG